VTLRFQRSIWATAVKPHWCPSDRVSEERRVGHCRSAGTTGPKVTRSFHAACASVAPLRSYAACVTLVQATVSSIGTFGPTLRPSGERRCGWHPPTRRLKQRNRSGTAYGPQVSPSSRCAIGCGASANTGRRVSLCMRVVVAPPTRHRCPAALTVRSSAQCVPSEPDPGRNQRIRLEERRTGLVSSRSAGKLRGRFRLRHRR
jgi:hypothetical protein